MRPPKALTSAAVLIFTALAEPTAWAQTASNPSAAPAPAPVPAAAPANPMSWARSARSLLRNGQDYIEFGEYDRALEFLREAETRQAELSPQEKKTLQQAIERARQGLRAPDAPTASRASARRAAVGRRPGAIVSAAPTDDSVQLTGTAPEPAPATTDTGVMPVQMTAPARPEIRSVSNPPAARAAPPELIPPPAALPPLPGNATPASAVPEMTLGTQDVDPLALTPSPAAAASPSEPALPDLPAAGDPAPVPTLAPAPAELKPLPVETSAPAPVPAETATPAPLPVETAAPAPLPAPADLTPPSVTEPAPTRLAVKPEEVAAPRSELPAPEAPLPPPAEEVTVPTPPPSVSDSAAPAQPSSIPDVTPAPAPESMPPPVMVPDAPIATPEATAAPASPEGGMTLPPLPAAAADSTAPERSHEPVLRFVEGVRPNVTLPPELSREVEDIASRLQLDIENTRGNSSMNPSRAQGALPGRDASPGLGGLIRGEPGGSVGGGAYGAGGSASTEPSSSESRIELPRVPSPTEPRPIRAIPIPEEFVPLTPRKWSPSRKAWASAATCHSPLYFQDAPLERYGMSAEQALGPLGRFASVPLDDPTQSNQRQQIIQPFWSVAKFGAQIVLWPFNMAMNPPWEAEYDLGYWRPGDKVPPDLLYWPITGYGPPLHGTRY